MIEVQDYIEENNLKSQMLMQVHDELVFNIIPEEEKVLTEKIKYIMENILDHEIKLIAEI